MTIVPLHSLTLNECVLLGTNVLDARKGVSSRHRRGRRCRRPRLPRHGTRCNPHLP